MDGRHSLKGERIVAEFIEILDGCADSHYAARDGVKDEVPATV